MAENILVTGAFGFVGGALCAELVSAGHSVRGVGRSIVKEPVFGLNYYSLDLEVDDLAGLDFANVDCVVHLAGQAHGRGESERQELNDFRRANVEVSIKLAKLAIEAGVRRFVFVSSIGVHGSMTDGEPISEDSPFNPGSPYTVSKAEAELELVSLFKTARSSELTIVRPPLVFSQNAPGNFGRLLKLACSPIPLPFGMCFNQRSLISLESLVEFLIACVSHPAAGNESFVVADSSAVSTGDVVTSLRAGMDRPTRLLPIPPLLVDWSLRLLRKREMYVQLFCDLVVDNQKAEKLLGWSPSSDTKRQLEAIGKRYANPRN